MKQKEVFKKIGGIIMELSDQYEYLKTVNDDLNDLELELFAANAHFLTDHIEILCKLNLQKGPEKRLPEKKQETAKEVKRETADEAKQETTYEKRYFEPVVQQMKPASQNDKEKPAKELFKPIAHEITGDGQNDENPVPEIDLRSETPADTYSFIREEPEMIRHELILDEAMELDDDEEIEVENGALKEPKKGKTNARVMADEPAPEVTEIKPSEVKPETKPGPVLTEEEVLTINQKMSSQLKDNGIARTEQLSIKPISDLKLAITLNDKLMYVKDLFNGYNLAYSEAIEILNRFNTFEEALRFLKTNYITKNNWESKPATTEKFYALLKRRYA